MRILCLFFHPQPSITGLGGAEKRFMETSRIWLNEGVKLIILESDPSLITTVKREIRRSSRLIHHPERNWLRIYAGWMFWMIRASLKGASIVRRKKPHVILATNNTLPNIVPAYFIHNISKLPLSVIVHHIDVPSTETQANWFTIYCMYRQMKYGRLVSILKTLAQSTVLFILRRSGECIAVSNSTARALIRNRVPEKKINVSSNGVNSRYIDKFKFGGGKLYDGIFVGRIGKEKGIYDLVNAWRETVAVKPDAKLAVVGTGVELEQVKRIIFQSHLEKNILVFGHCSDREMYLKMKASRVFVLPSLLEGWGLAVAEALACGLPAICYDIPAIREVFGACKSVFLVTPKDEEKLSSTIIKVLQMDLERLAELSKTYIKRFDWNTVALNDLETIKRTVSSRHNRKI
jgi:glycosyltransferase involved in cell wall biosynthesis